MVPFLRSDDGEHAVMEILNLAPALRRNRGNHTTFSAFPPRFAEFKVDGRLIGRMVADGRLEWVNRCRSAVRLKPASAELTADLAALERAIVGKAG